MKPRALHLLNPKQVKSLGPGKHADGGGLYLIVEKSTEDGTPGARRWAFLYSLTGRRREMGLGSARTVELKDARIRAAAARELVEQGKDPKEERDAEAEAEAQAVAAQEAQAADEPPPITFKAFALEVLATKKKDWRGRKTENRWLNGLNVHCAAIASVPVADLTTAHVLAVLNPIWETIPAGAQKTQGIIEMVLDSARAKGLRDGDNPAKWQGLLEHLLPKRRKQTRGSHAALAFAKVADFMADLRKREGAGAKALELAVLTGARTTEVREATWGEFDLAEGLWSIPRDRVKERGSLERAKVTHKRIPLAPQAVEMLKAWRDAEREWRKCPPEAFVFLGPKDGVALGVNGMLSVLTRMDVPVTVHGFRSTFRDWAAVQRVRLRSGRTLPAYSWEAVEISLGHTVGNATTRAYFRGDLLDERRDLMADWAEYCDGGDPLREEEPAGLEAAFLAFLAGVPGVAEAWEAFNQKRAA